jgi:hypothetical protein
VSDYAAEQLPEDVLAGPVPLWGVWNSRTARWVREPGPDRTPTWFVTETLAGRYAKKLAASRP